MAGDGYESGSLSRKRKGKAIATPFASRPDSVHLKPRSDTPTAATPTPETATSGAVGSSNGHTSPLTTTFNIKVRGRSADGHLCIKSVSNTSFFSRLPTVNYISRIYKSYFFRALAKLHLSSQRSEGAMMEPI